MVNQLQLFYYTKKEGCDEIVDTTEPWGGPWLSSQSALMLQVRAENAN